jgi:hypothetical protein
MIETSPSRSSIAARVLSIALVVAGAAACDDTTTKPGLGPDRVAVGVVSVVTPASIAVATLPACAGAVASPELSVFVSSARTNAFLDGVTLHLNDGSNVGGPTVTIPRADLNSLFGSTLIRAGSSRTFGFRPSFRCVPLQAQLVRGEFNFIDEFGVRQTMTTTMSFR